MMDRIATIILSQGQPHLTDKLYEHLLKFDSDSTDIFVVERSSDTALPSKYSTWYANWPEATSQGLTYCHGMNFGLSQLWREGEFTKYKAFFLLSNNVAFQDKPTIAPLTSILNQHPRVGVLSPSAERWGERLLLRDQKTKYFWFVHNHALLLRRELLESILNEDEPGHMNFIFDGNNFPGYCLEYELIGKAYANDWATAITSEIIFEESDVHILGKSDLLKPKLDEELRNYIEEGDRWLRKKYGFNSHWSMRQYVKNFYLQFFEFYPEFLPYRI